MVDVGWIGSPADVGTLVAGLVLYVYEVKPQNRLRSAAIVALARVTGGVDDQLLQEDLDVDDRTVAKVTNRVIACGGEETS